MCVSSEATRTAAAAILWLWPKSRPLGSFCTLFLCGAEAAKAEALNWPGEAEAVGQLGEATATAGIVVVMVAASLTLSLLLPSKCMVESERGERPQSMLRLLEHFSKKLHEVLGWL